MATPQTEDWTKAKCIRLIQEYRARPALWDPKNSHYYKKPVKPAIWQEIGDALNISPEKCKQKMINLMSSLRREKAKIVHSIKESKDPADLYVSTWFAFKHMAFLMDKDTERERQQIGAEDDNEEERTNPYLTIALKMRNSSVATKRRRQSESVQQELPQIDTHSDREDGAKRSPQPTASTSQTTTERDEEIKSFTAFIGNKMKKYSDTTKNAVQQAICEIIFKADQNYYEPNCFETLTIIDEESDLINKTMFLSQNKGVKVQNDSDVSD